MICFLGKRKKTGNKHSNTVVIRKKGLPAVSVNKENDKPAASLMGSLNRGTGNMEIAIKSANAKKS